VGMDSSHRLDILLFSPVDGNKSDHHMVESILKSAAENFPGTPSILRRRKREKPMDAQENNFKIDILNGDSFHTPFGKMYNSKSAFIQDNNIFVLGSSKWQRAI
jgi:hypothetical protein